MRWTVILVPAFVFGCSPSPVQPTGAPPAAGPAAASFTISGVVREAGTNAAVEGASVCWSNTHEPHCGRTDADGAYRFVVPEGPGAPPTARDTKICPGAARSDFEYRQTCVPWAAGAVWSPVLQRRIQIEAGRTVTAIVVPEEGSGLALMDECSGCKRIQVLVPQTGTLAVRLTADPASRLRLAQLGPDEIRSLDGPIAVTAAQTVTVIVVGAVAPAEFTVSTTLTPR